MHIRDQRDMVVEEARSWIGTPYHHHAAVRGAGVDCGMLLVEVYSSTGLIERFDPGPYPPDWHMHRSEERYLTLVMERARPVTSPLPGDIVMLRYGRAFSHGGIVTKSNPLTAVHAFYRYGKVVEEDWTMSMELRLRLSGAIFASLWSE